jgi:hypothetical protein
LLFTTLNYSNAILGNGAKFNTPRDHKINKIVVQLTLFAKLESLFTISVKFGLVAANMAFQMYSIWVTLKYYNEIIGNRVG